MLSEAARETEGDSSVLTTYTYDEFGILENPEEGTTKGILFAYTGYGYEESTGLYDAKARYYDAETGRFLSEDQYYGTPMEPANQNRYVYVRNNPLKYTDPSGNVVLVDDMVILVIITAGVVYSYTVTVGYLKTEKGKLLLDNAKKVIYDGTTYLKDKFSKIISGIGEQVKKGFEAFDKACKELIDLFSRASKKSNTKKKNGSKRKGQTGKNGNGGKNSNNWNHRDKYLKIAKNSLLINAINQLYRPGAYTGDVGTADILIHEFLTGQPLKHLQKARDMIDYLNRIISTQKLYNDEKKLAYQLLNELYNAFKRVTGK